MNKSGRVTYGARIQWSSARPARNVVVNDDKAPLAALKETNAEDADVHIERNDKTLNCRVRSEKCKREIDKKLMRACVRA
jgi:hypothetical protein